MQICAAAVQAYSKVWPCLCHLIVQGCSTGVQWIQECIRCWRSMQICTAAMQAFAKGWPCPFLSTVLSTVLWALELKHAELFTACIPSNSPGMSPCYLSHSKFAPPCPGVDVSSIPIRIVA